MKIRSILIRNFRGLVNLEAEFCDGVNVIVGPNAVGKTSVLEAIRLVRCLLSPRTNADYNEVLTHMGAKSQTGVFHYGSLVGDPTLPLEIELKILLDAGEVSFIEKWVGRLAILKVRDKLAISPAQDDSSLIQYMSSLQGQQVLLQCQEEARSDLEELKKEKTIILHLIIDSRLSQIRGTNLTSQEILRLLEERQPANLSGISYFPADRAMPTGKANIQISSADNSQQISSHIANPALKYQRMKQFIFTQTFLDEATKKQSYEDFALIFEGLLVGKALKECKVGNNGQLSVLIVETATGKTFDIDQMSSGEKGLILQFLLMRRSIRRGGIVLLDEPELHLNPAVTRKLLQFVIKNVSEFADIQAIICTHSPEILADAYDSDRCRLLHLRSGTDISPVLQRDKSELFEALRRLGATTGDVLFFRGSLFVEGPHDAEILERAFPTRVAGFKVVPLRGRAEVEKEIRTLQANEKSGDLTTRQLFIFDHDGKPTDLVSSELVKLLQWDRYCLENYLIDAEVIFDVCQTLALKNGPESRGSLPGEIKRLAFEQLRTLAANSVYSDCEPQNAGISPKEIDKLADFGEIADTLLERINRIKEQVDAVDGPIWKTKFVVDCEYKLEALTLQWEGEDKWKSLCDGKKLLSALHRQFQTSISLLEFKRRIAAEMSKKESESWLVVDGLLNRLVS